MPLVFDDDPGDVLQDLFGDVAHIVLILSDVTATPPRDVISRLVREHRSPGVLVREALRERRITPSVWTADMAGFYASTDALLYESLCWNRSATKEKMRKWIGRFLREHIPGLARVLVYGDGPGVDSFFLASAGYRVDYYDTSEAAQRFAGRLFSDHGVTARVVLSRDEATSAQYDAIVCLDVLEHLSEPAQHVRWLTERLAPGGMLVIHAPFWYTGPRVPTHLVANRKFSGNLGDLFGSLGLGVVAGRSFWHPIVLAKDAAGMTAVRDRQAAAWRIGALLLPLARHWNMPYLLAYRVLSGLRRPGWPELETLARSQV